MDLKQLRESMKSVLSVSRYRHTLGVEEVCYDLALIHGDDTLKASIAGILHDCAKYLNEEDLIKECERNQIKMSETERKLPMVLLHAKVGAIYAKEKYGVIDDEILMAIEFHTTGRPGMSMLEKIVYIADYIEPNRSMIPNINYIRETAYKDLNKAIELIIKQTLQYLSDNKNIIDPLTKVTYEYYVNKNNIKDYFI